jgi:ParB family chromosome partitioning protein
MLIDLDLIDTTQPNACIVPPTAEADAALLASIRKRGVLAGILVRPLGDRFDLVFGYRRVRLSREAGLPAIEATVHTMTDLEVLEAQVMENMHRRTMHPVDRWNAARDMIAAGETIEDAAIALGYNERQTRQMKRLGELHPKLLDLAVKLMPTDWQLKKIATASRDQQAKALTVQFAVRGDLVDWNVIASACKQTRIPRAWALFDVAASGILFEEDLFAEPGADDQFTTSEIGAFMAAQKAALAADVVARRKRNERVAAVEWRRDGIVVPNGWTRRHGPPAGVPKGPTGQTRFVAIAEGGDHIGKVVEVDAVPPVPFARAPKAAALTVPRPGGDAVAAAEDSETDTEIDRPALTKRGRQIIAASKTQALREHLLAYGANLPLELLGACLVVALAGDNVFISGDTRWRRVGFTELLPRLIDPTGRLQLEDAPIAGILAEALAIMLTVTDPVTGLGSGLPAEWIGNALGAGMKLPRFDTAEFLATVSKPELLAIARDVDIAVPDKVSALRERLCGNAPHFRPTTFGAPGPVPEREERQKRPAEETVT